MAMNHYDRSSRLLRLPVEILASLPCYLNNIEDFNNVLSTCRTLRSILGDTSPNVILRLYDASAPTFCQPHPHFIIAATARELSRWSLKSSNNTQRLVQAFRQGIDGLKDLCIEICGITMSDIRRLHLLRFTAINPVSNIIDACAGPTWYETPDFWDGGVSEPATLDTVPIRATFQILIYGELFHEDMNSFLYPDMDYPRHDTETRLEFIRYCVPDFACRLAYYGMRKPDDVGPYSDDNERIRAHADQIAVQYIVNCGTWKKRWTATRAKIGSDFPEDFDGAWKQDMWDSYVQMSGYEGFKSFSGGNADEYWFRKMAKAKYAIQRLDQHKDHPEEKCFGYGQNSTWEFPRLATDVYVLMCGYWPQPRANSP